jgi:hypothetical protein
MNFLKTVQLSLFVSLLMLANACKQDSTPLTGDQSVKAFQEEVLKASGGVVTHINIGDQGEVTTEERCPNCPVTIDPEPGPCTLQIFVFLGAGAQITVSFSNGQPPLVLPPGPIATTLNITTTSTYANVTYNYVGPKGKGGISVLTTGAGSGESWDIPQGSPQAYQTNFFSFFICDNGQG